MTAAALANGAGNDGRCFNNEVDTPGQARFRLRISADSEDEETYGSRYAIGIRCYVHY